MTWQLYPANPIVRPGAPGQWDELWATWASVVRVAPDEWRMYYSGKDRVGRLRIGVALSCDGLRWEKSSGNPVMDTGGRGSWDSRYVYAPAVWKDEDTWRMVFTGCDYEDHYQVGVARSADGILWEKWERNPVFSDWRCGLNRFGRAETEAWGIAKIGSKYVMLYNTVTIKPRQIYGAESADLVKWKRIKQRPLIPSEGRPSELGYMKYCASSLVVAGSNYIFAAVSDKEYNKSAIGLWKVDALLDGGRPRFVGYVVRAGEEWCKMEVDMPFTVCGTAGESARNIHLYFGGKAVDNRWAEGMALGRMEMMEQ